MADRQEHTEVEKQHKRRVRYAGRYPKKYSEKYKELHPEKYAGTIKKVISKGSTPAGTHIPIMVREILEILQIRPGEKGMDATLGYGGHTLEMLKRLDGTGHIYAVDVDPIESEKTKKRLETLGYGEERITIRHMNFAQIDQMSEKAGLFDFILADLGVSSMQLDNPARGFSYKHNGPLDLRMDPGKGVSAAQRLRGMNEEELVDMLRDNSDEPYAGEIAHRIISDMRRGQDIDTTGRLHHEIEKALQGLPEENRKEAVKRSSARVFQALRIDVNSEFGTLYTFLKKLPYAAAPGCRIAILTFHSGEDRLVKKSFREFRDMGLYREIAENVIRPSAEECARNGRARPAKLRWAVRAQ